MENRKVTQLLFGWRGLVPVGKGRIQGKGVGGEYVRNTMYTCMKNGKMRPVETIPGMGEGV
jgi:hypothetical protein